MVNIRLMRALNVAAHGHEGHNGSELFAAVWKLPRNSRTPSGLVTVNHRPLSLPVSGDTGTRVLIMGIVRTTRHLGLSCLAVGLWESGRHSTYNTKE